MAMNREQKRALQRAGQLNEDGSPVSTRDRRPAPVRSERTPPRQFLREVRSELRKVSWPTREETIRYAIIVGIGIIVMTLFVFGADYVFTTAFRALFDPGDEGAAAALALLPLVRLRPLSIVMDR